MTSLYVPAWTALVSLAEEIPDADDVKPGWIGFTVVALLAVAVVLLIFSFRKQLRKVHFDEPSDGDGGPGSGRDGAPGSGTDTGEAGEGSRSS